MPIRSVKVSRQESPYDIGTLWILRHQDRTARCALVARKATWEVCVLVDREVLLSERCTRLDETFSLAERWKTRMLEAGWRKVVPPSPEPPPAS
jgi:hypothetical protein